MNGKVYRALLCLAVCVGCSESPTERAASSAPSPMTQRDPRVRTSLLEVEPVLLHASWGAVDPAVDDVVGASPEHPSLPLSDRGAARYEFERTAADHLRGIEVFVR